MKKIAIIKGKNPIAILIEDKKIKLVIEEEKLPVEIKDNYPTASVEIIKVMHNLENPKIEELPDDKLIRELPHPYFGLSYSKESVFNLVRNSGLYYRQYIHDPKKPIFVKPIDFYKDVAKLIKKGLKVGWFQGRWGVDTLVDLNRCILFEDKKKFSNIESFITHPVLLKSLIDLCDKEHLIAKNLEAYNPQQAIQKLKDKEIDVLVITNLIVTIMGKERMLN